MSERKILWIEEEVEDILTEYRTYLLNAGYSLDVVQSPKEAEKSLRTKNYDLIILDIRLIPGEDPEWHQIFVNGEKRLGLKLLHDIISKDENLKKKIVVFTNEMYSDVRDELSKNGIPESHFLRKRNTKIPEQLEEFILKHIN